LRIQTRKPRADAANRSRCKEDHPDNETKRVVE
jgi:hypothetical protein